ncbi:MAG: amidase [Pseudomonadota bacterium]
MSDDIVFKSASELASDIRDQRISARDVMEAFLTKIEQVNPIVNAVCTLDTQNARAQADTADQMLLSGKGVGPLHGLPIAIKDLHATAGMLTTLGSPIYADSIPSHDHLHVARLRAAGAIIIGKTNTPEFGAGSQTFNQVFGVTRNPYRLDRTPGGSSGGAAAAVASGMLPFADGSDMGGSLRNPAAYCNVLGFRPAPGRIPTWPTTNSQSRLSVPGPIARNATDLALFLQATAGPDDRVPLSIDEPPSIFAAPLERAFDGVNVAWSPRLGQYEVDAEVIAVCERALMHFESIGCEVVRRDPNFSDADEIFQTLRAQSFALNYSELYRNHRDALKDTVIWNIEQGQRLSGPDISRAESLRTQLIAELVGFFEDVEYLLCPTTQVPPFSHDIDWIREINGVEMQTYIDWMGVCYAITVTGCPALSFPVGFTESGLPVGMQLVGRPKRDFAVLQLAHALEDVCTHGQTRPDLTS